jgi:hypothetical protein
MVDKYGLEFNVGADNRVVIDSEFSRMTVKYRGRYTGTEESGNSSTTYFPSPITSQEQPLVFIRPDSANGIIGMSNLAILGSPGNWVGFKVRIYNKYTIKPNGRWFAAGFDTSLFSEFGVWLWDGNAKPLFDSGGPAANFVRSTNNWTYTGSGQTGQGQSINYFNAPFTMGENEYLMINNLTMMVNTGGVLTGREVNLMWNYPERIITMAVIGIPGYNTIFIGITVLVAKENS